MFFGLKEVAAEVLRMKMNYPEGLNLLSSFPSTSKVHLQEKKKKQRTQIKLLICST